MDTKYNVNISNLIALWKTVGQSFQSYSEQKYFNYCFVPGSEWPNRIWFKELTISIHDSLPTIAEIFSSSKVPLSLSFWSDFENSGQAIFEEFGFARKSEQIGMSLTLQQKYYPADRIVLKRLDNAKEAAIWSEIYPRSFGYKISPEVLTRTMHLISYYLVYFDQQPIGTTITYETGDVIGIHGLGVIPEFRKQGFAGEVMMHLLNDAIDNGFSAATLQSSKLGKNIYMNMGFSEDFLMTNYVIA